MGFAEAVTVTLISAAVALLISLLFRWLDTDRPRWKLSTDGLAIPRADKTGFSLEVTVANVGNGAAHDAALIGVLRSYAKPTNLPVVHPGDSLAGLVPIRLRQKPQFLPLGDPKRVRLSGRELRGLRVELRWYRPPFFLIPKRRRFRLDVAASHARSLFRDQRSL